MTDITHDNVFTNSDTVPRLRRILDEGPALPERAADHEIAPHVPAKEKTGGELLADKSIGIVDEAANLVLTKFKELRDQIEEAEQAVLYSQVDARETIRQHMKIVEAAVKCQQQIQQQITEAVAPLLARNGSKP